MNSYLPKRLVSLDIFRGVTIAGMIVVNNLSAWTDTPRFPRLTHAEWNGCTLADLIFPCFIFIVGVSAVFSLSRRLEKGEPRSRLYRHEPPPGRRAGRYGSCAIEFRRLAG